MAKLVKLIVYIAVIYSAVGVNYASGFELDEECLTLAEVKFMSVGSIELPLNWRYQPPMAYEDGTNFKLNDYIKENCGGLHEFWASLKDKDGSEIACIVVSNRELTRSGYDLDWLHPVRFITQADVNRIEASRLMEMPTGYYAGNICPDTKAIVRKQRVNNLLGIMNISCIVDEDEDKWQSYRVTLYNGEYSIMILLKYNSAYAEYLEPLLQRVLNSALFVKRKYLSEIYR